MVSVIAAAVVKALELDIDDEREDQALWYNSAPSEWPEVISKAVMAAISEAGNVEWGVRDCDGYVDEWRHKENAEAAVKSIAIGCDDPINNPHKCGKSTPGLVTRKAFAYVTDWERAE